MDLIDVQKEVFEEVEILGHKALFTELRVDTSTVPKGVFYYALRHGDDDSYPATLEMGVGVNYFGSVLLDRKIELDEVGMRSVGYENFGYTGEEMKLSDFMEKHKCIPFMKASELTAFIDNNGISPQLTEQEAEILLGYMDGHGCMIGHRDEEIVCKDVCGGEEEQIWKPYSLDDAINDACNCNFDMILQAQQELESTDEFDEYEQVNTRLESLREDEKVLDVMFERIKYGIEIKNFAEQLADNLFEDLEAKVSLDDAIQRMAEAINAREDLFSNAAQVNRKGKVI